MEPYSYSDARSFLRAWLSAAPGRSARKLAGQLQCSPSLISQICSGKRRMTPAVARRFCKVAALDDRLTTYFLDLVEADRNTQSHRMAAAARRLSEGERVTEPEIFTRWPWGAIWQLSLCVGFRADPAWIASVMIPPVSVQEASEALVGLEALGLLVPSGPDGVLCGVPVDRATLPKVPPGAMSRALVEWHRRHLLNIADRTFDLSPRERVQAGVTLALPAGKLDQISEMFDRLIQTILSDIAIGEPSQVFQVQIGVVALTKNTADVG